MTTGEGTQIPPVLSHATFHMGSLLSSLWEFWVLGPFGQLPRSDVCAGMWGWGPVRWGACWVWVTERQSWQSRVQIDFIFFCSPVSPLYSGRKESSLGHWNTPASALPLCRTLLKLRTRSAGKKAEYWPKQRRGEHCTGRCSILTRPSLGCSLGLKHCLALL